MHDEKPEEPGVLETDAVLVRNLRQEDLDAVVAIDTAGSGRRRPRYFERMLARALAHADFQVSLIAELEDRVVGFLLATLYYGEYGVVEPSASIDAIGVDPRHRGRRVGRAMMRQLRLNLGALHIEKLRTEVAWHDFELLGFFRGEGFVPAARLCLERPLDPTTPEP